jgi:hypothetical protein
MSAPGWNGVAVDLVIKDFFDKTVVVSDVPLVWNERSKAFCNSWPTRRDYPKWEIGGVLALACGGGRLIVTHSSDPSKEIPSNRVERILQDIRRLPGFWDC